MVLMTPTRHLTFNSDSDLLKGFDFSDQTINGFKGQNGGGVEKQRGARNRIPIENY